MFLVSRTDCSQGAVLYMYKHTINCMYVCDTDLYIDINDETLG